MPEYNPRVFFEPRNVSMAMQIAVTAEDSSTDDRVRRETPHLCDLMDEYVPVGVLSRVMDYGCGPGRVAKEVISRHQCTVFGVDISPPMRALAIDYLGEKLSNSFIPCHPSLMNYLPSMDVVMSIWCLQHVVDIEDTVTRIIMKLKPRGRLFVVNANDRIIPTSQGWTFNEPPFDLKMHLTDRMLKVATGQLSTEHVTPLMAAHGWWGVFERHA